nr:sterol carrier protein domain-containing protein [Spelaeicoccus albus]
MLVPAPGSVEIVDAGKLREIGPAVFDDYHRVQIGSVGRQGEYADIISGDLGENGEPDPAVRAAVHYDDAGVIDGYVSYKFAGWGQTPGTIDLIDLIALNPGAYRGLWEFLGSIDLVTRIKIPGALGDDLLAASLVDARTVNVTEDRDHLWLRILDTAACLEARDYDADGRLTFRVDDSLGYAAGTYLLEVAGGRGTVTKEPDDAPSDFKLDVADLSAIYLGAVSPLTLIDAGRITAASRDVATTLRAVFAPGGSVWCTTEF